MKNLMLILFIVVANFCFAQQTQVHLPMDAANKVSFSGNMPKDSLSKDDLFVKARVWVAQIIGSDGKVTMEDKESGNIVAKASKTVEIEALGVRRMNFSVTITVKPNSVKYVFSDISFQGGILSTSSNACENIYKDYLDNYNKRKNDSYAKQLDSFVQQTNNVINQFIKELKVALMN